MVDSKYYGKLDIIKDKTNLDSGIIYVPYIFSEHTEESVKEYNDFMREYNLKHKYCPVCGSESCKTTLMGFPLYKGKEEEYMNRNSCACMNCDNKHIYHDRVGKISATEQMYYVLSHSPKPMPENIVEEVNRSCKEIVDMITTEFKENKTRKKNMRDLIMLLNITKFNSLIEIEELLLSVRDFSPEYYLIKKLNVNSYINAAKEIHEYLNNK